MNIKNNKIVFFISIVVIFCLFAILPLPWNNSVKNSLVDLQFKLRGSRDLSDDLLVVFIGDEDLKSLDSWPISRDYYSYAIHILNSKGAKVIALDVLLVQKDKYHPEFDQTLIDFVKNSGNVCLPMAFTELIATDSLYVGVSATYPFEKLNKNAAGIGFSNFSKMNNARNVPLLANYQNELIPSFGLQMATSFLDKDFSDAVNKNGCIRLNHFGSIENVNNISFVDLLQAYKDNPDSLNFEGKLVLVTVTAAGVANLKSTPFDNAFPSSLVHLTAAENFIYKNYLIEIPLYVKLVILLLLASGIWSLLTLNRKYYLIFSFIFLLIYWIVAMLLFNYSNLILPLFYPTLVIITIVFVDQLLSHREKQQMDTVLQGMLKNQLNSKENQLQQTKEKLAELNNQLQKESVSKEVIQQQSEENKNQVLQLEKEIRDLKSYETSDAAESIEKIEYENIIYSKDSKMAEVLDLVSKVVTSDIPVLILGNTGTGKEMIANAIHKKSNRNNAPFIALNCGALPETLLESELFGHEKGSFTGAVAMRKGKFELADGGVIFLDEISETSPNFQSKLLRVLQESTFERVGGENSIRVNVRVIAATNKNLQNEIDEGRFRSDLFFRLNGFPISIPPLNERQEDIHLLCKHFLAKHNFNVSMSDVSMQFFLNYEWPGNVRELENIVRRAAIMATSADRKLVRIEDLPDELKSHSKNQNIDSIHKPLEEQILESLRSLKFSRSAISQTAKALGNKDRGTITEYFRGICFQQLTKSDFDISTASYEIAGTNNQEVIKQVISKMNEYLNNLKSSINETDNLNIESLAKGLPKKYHEYLNSVISYLTKIN